MVIDLNDSSNNTKPRLTKCEFMVAGPERRRAVIEKVNEPTIRVGCKNDRYRFQLRRPEKSPLYLIESIETGRARADVLPWNDLDAYFVLYAESFINAPIKVEGFVLPEIVTKPDFVCESAEEVDRGGVQLIDVHFRYRHQEPGFIPLEDAHVLLDPENGWSVIEYSVENSDVVYNANVTYSEAIVPGAMFRHPIKVVATIRSAGRQKSSDVTENEYTLDEITFGAIDDREFTLSAFGLPEVSEKGPPARSGARLWTLLTINAAFVLILVGLYFLRQKATKNSGGNSPNRYPS